MNFISIQQNNRETHMAKPINDIILITAEFRFIIKISIWDAIKIRVAGDGYKKLFDHSLRAWEEGFKSRSKENKTKGRNK